MFQNVSLGPEVDGGGHVDAEGDQRLERDRHALGQSRRSRGRHQQEEIAAVAHDRLERRRGGGELGGEVEIARTLRRAPEIGVVTAISGAFGISSSFGRLAGSVTISFAPDV